MTRTNVKCMLYCEFQAIKNQILETRTIYFNTQKTNGTNPLPILHFDLAFIEYDDDKNNMTETTGGSPNYTTNFILQ